MRLFLDANVLFSAARRGSGLHRLVVHAVLYHEVLTSDYAMEEALRNLHTKRPDWVACLREIAQQITVVKSVDAATPVAIVPKDRPIFVTAVTNACDYLVTGDQSHFGHLMEVTDLPLRIVSPLRMAEILARPAEK